MDGIIFDVDGTLWNSTEVVADAWDEYVKSQGITDIPMSAERLSTLFGQLLSEIARQLFWEYPEDEQLRLIDGCCEAEHAALRRLGAPLYPRVSEVIKTLSKKYPLFIVSNCQAGYIEVFLECTGLAPYITDHLCPGDTGVAKAANIMKIVEKHHLQSPVYVGDTAGDAAACKEASVPFIFAAYGFGDVADPDDKIEEFSDLLKLVSHPEK